MNSLLTTAAQQIKFRKFEPRLQYLSSRLEPKMSTTFDINYKDTFYKRRTFDQTLHTVRTIKLPFMKHKRRRAIVFIAKAYAINTTDYYHIKH